MPQTVLTVDDEALVRSGLARTLAREPFRLLQAASGEEALALLDAEPIDVVLTDDRMPGMMGSELSGLIHAAHPEVVVLMLTGDTTIGSLAQAINQGHIHRLLFKPCAPDNLRQALRVALTHKLIWDRCRDAIPLLSQVNTLLDEIGQRPLHPSATHGLAGTSLAELAGRLDVELERLRTAYRETVTVAKTS